MLIGARMGTALPYDRRVDFISRLSGNCHILTSTAYDKTKSVEIEVSMYVSTQQAITVVGWDGGGGIKFNTDGWTDMSNDGSTLVSGTTTTPTVFKISIAANASRSYYTYGSYGTTNRGVSFTNSSGTGTLDGTSLKYPLFGVLNKVYTASKGYVDFVSGVGGTILRCCGFKGKVGGELIDDLVPVIARFDGVQEYCMFNRAYTPDGAHGQQFYRARGTGVFTGGMLS